MNIRHESGCFHSFCPLASIGWLHKKIKRSFHLVLGTRVCASFIQNAFGMMLFAKPRFATAVLEDADIYHGPSFENLTSIVGEIKSEFPLDVLFLWNTCPAEILKTDLVQWARKLESASDFRVVPVTSSGLDVSFTDGEDSLLAALTDISAQAPEEDNIVMIGSVAETVETELALELKNLSFPVRFLPPSSIQEVPYLGRRSTVVFLQPYLSRTLQKVKKLGCSVVSAPMPLGASATRSFIERIYARFGKKTDLSQREEKIHSLNASFESAMAGKSFFIFPDTNLEIPLARFVQEMGGHITEVGTPALDEELLSVDLDTLRTIDLPVYVRPDYGDQMQRLSNNKPDLIIAPLALSNSLIEDGYRVKLSMDFLLLPLQGFSNHRSLLELFVQALEG